ncbi:unnamed protein product [Pseudo-nitzschia multistriata]|uniref:Uncharacterized protein n=1 Tax=Pseudo-nitzschia multistriata TaxID=183589 RepID=A0A448YUK3_9STRA|nr:unnamed protein product [Pseudo-nitzschia multistriata]
MKVLNEESGTIDIDQEDGIDKEASVEDNSSIAVVDETNDQNDSEKKTKEIAKSAVSALELDHVENASVTKGEDDHSVDSTIDFTEHYGNEHRNEREINMNERYLDGMTILAIECDNDEVGDEKEIVTNGGTERHTTDGKQMDLGRETAIFNITSNNKRLKDSMDRIERKTAKITPILDFNGIGPIGATNPYFTALSKVEAKDTTMDNYESGGYSTVCDEKEPLTSDPFQKQLVVMKKGGIIQEKRPKKIVSMKKINPGKRCRQSNKPYHAKFTSRLPVAQEKGKQVKVDSFAANNNLSSKDKSKTSTDEKHNGVPLWKIHSKDFIRKGEVQLEKIKDSKQDKRLSRRKEVMRRPFTDRLNHRVDAKNRETVIKKTTPKPMAMSKRNEEHMKKFMERQLVGRQDRDQKEKEKRYVHYVRG